MIDTDQYRTCREVGTQLNNDIPKVYSDRELIIETVPELDIEFGGLNLACEFGFQVATHFEFALCRYRRDGTAAAERYLETKYWEGGTGRNILEATVGVGLSLFGVESISNLDSRLTATDLLDDREEHALLDANLSRITKPRTVLFFRPARHNEFTTASGVSFPFPGKEKTHLLKEHEYQVKPDKSKTTSR